MFTHRFFRALILGIIATTGLGRAFADEPRNCPSLVDQVVRVSPASTAVFRLAVANGDQSDINIFQFPLSGALQQVGPTPLDFAFTAGAEFRGTSTFTYRLTPPFGCGRGAMLGKVTLVGGPADSTTPGVTIDPETGLSPRQQDNQVDPLALLGLLSLANGGGSSLCGLGGLPFFLFTGATLVCVRSRRRRK